MKRALLAASLAMAVAGTAVLVSRLPSEQPVPPPGSPLSAFNAALRRHDYKQAYALTDLTLLTVQGTAALDIRSFTAFVRAHHFQGLALSQGLVHIATTSLRLTAPTGPLPSLAIDGVPVPLRASRVRPASAAQYIYRYAIAVISGPHTLGIGAGPITAARALQVSAGGDATTVNVPLSLGNIARTTRALDGVIGTCHVAEQCILAPCSGRGSQYVLDAWGIGTPPIVGRSLAGGSVVAPMPPDGWSVVITFIDQGQPPGISGKEQTRSLRARYVFGFGVGGRAQLLDKCWVSKA